MTKKHIIIGIIILISVIVIWKMFFSKKTVTKNALALAASNDCLKAKAEWPGLKAQLTDAQLATWSDSELNDLVYPLYTALSKLGIGTLPSTMTKQQKIDALHKVISFYDNYIQTC